VSWQRVKELGLSWLFRQKISNETRERSNGEKGQCGETFVEWKNWLGREKAHLMVLSVQKLIDSKL
jgi:hypothetical protein